ncbi:MAG: helix-hairpin-helix domain-containing protein, partial [Desulfuromonadaceae bacterium]
SKRLSSIPGIGKKTADRMILELQEKVKKLTPEGTLAPPHRATASQANVIDDSLSALLNLGYKEGQARKALESLDLAANTPVQEALKQALKILMK